MDGEVSGAVVWHREELRIRDHPAVTAALDEADVVLPRFVFGPGFYGENGLACDARIRFPHECLVDLSDRYCRVLVRFTTPKPAFRVTRFCPVREQVTTNS
ncbi:deoxyribodipyrimidine photo-lyase [Salinigranum marinum]|uniref:deoxyribodipyrimidine photo-lyase n=1 Tax=Salinigranum marinum TaxID=1515595 RepID=UPI00298A0650|nr:deoxyribodipyrimidine photo-lyase [Salinigranum marinum]